MALRLYGCGREQSIELNGKERREWSQTPVSWYFAAPSLILNWSAGVPVLCCVVLCSGIPPPPAHYGAKRNLLIRSLDTRLLSKLSFVIFNSTILGL